MSVQVLVATMNQSDYSLLNKMRIASDAIVGNQCDRNKVESFEYCGNTVSYLNFSERGVGLNRNNALMRANGDICVFADDDEIFVENYSNVIQQAFDNMPNADVIIFNVKGRDTGRNKTLKIKRIGRLNFLKYGTVRIAVRLAGIKENGIFFNLCYGGGTRHCHGEDNLFLAACLDKGLKIYAVPDYIAELDESRLSTWNNGFDEKYLRDQGSLYHTMSSKWWKLLCLQDAIRRSGQYGMNWFQAYKIMLHQC